MSDHFDKVLFGQGDTPPPDDEPVNIPDEHYAALGKVADAWADLEFEIHQLIWTLMGVPAQPLGACVTAQMIGLGPPLRALRALVNLWQISAPIVKELGEFERDSQSLVETRNRTIHDKRLILWKTKEVTRFQVTAQRRLIFEPVVESIESLEKFRVDVFKMIERFTNIKSKILGELNTPPGKLLERLPYITQLRPPRLDPEPAA